MTACVYCLETGQLDERQVLLRGETLYLCAPRGQMIEGYLVLAPYRCIGSLSQLPAGDFADVKRFTAIVADFYRKAYGTTGMTIYEQGRGGGGATADGADGFPLHAHLCCLPLSVDLHGELRRRYAARTLAGPHQLAMVARDAPYLYVESMDEKVAYLAPIGTRRAELERTRLKVTIASLIGCPERGDWRVYPGDRELEHLIERWRTYASAN